MDIFEYSDRAYKLASPLDHNLAVAHAALGITSEVGEILEIVTSIQKNGVVEDTITQLKLEIGDCIWYTNRMLRELGLTFSDLALDRLTAPDFHPPGADALAITLAITHDMSVAVGHISDLAKKLVCAGKPVPVPEMLRSLTILWNDLTKLSSLSALTWDDILDANIAKLEARYTTGKFTAAEADHRAANDEKPSPFTIVK